MFRWFRPKIRICGNRRDGCSFKATINCLIWNDVKLVGLQNCYLEFSKCSSKRRKFPKFSTFVFLFQHFPPQNQFKKTYNMLEGNCWCICVHNFRSISSKITEIWRKRCQKQALFTSFRDLTMIFQILFFDRFWRFKKCLGPFSSSLRKPDQKTCIAALNPETFWFDLFYLVTWHDLDLSYGHKAQEMILTHVSNTTHADSLALFALNIKIVLVNITQTEKSNILALTWPVTSSVTSRSNFAPSLESSRSGISNGVWILEIGLVVWEITGGRGAIRPPQNVWLRRVQRGSGSVTHAR